MVGKVEHHCEYAERVKELEALRAELETKLNAALAQLDALTRRVLGPSSERMPSTTEELRGERKKNGQKADPEKTKEQRRKNAAERAAKTVETHETSFVPNEQRTCPHCEREAKTISTEKTSTQWDYVPGYLRRRVVHRESVACSCGLYVKMAPPPPKILGQSLYSSRFVAHLVVSKLSESLSIYRLEKRFKRYGVLMPRSTMNALFQKTGAEVRILARRVLELIVEQRVVQGDETSLPVLDEKKCRRGFIWTFSSRLMQGGEADDDDDSGGIVLVGYVYSKDRSGKTPAAVLGGTQGVLLVDGYTGYNVVTMPKGRVRAGCLAHPRRKFFDALSSAPDDARRAMELILDVYRVEHEASKRGIVRTQDHAELRRTEGRAAMNAFKAWLDERKDAHPPKSPIGRAIAHARNNWDRLCVFLDDVTVPIDNNFSEAALRAIAKKRDNWLFAGSDESAENIAALMTLTATCDANGINPELYLADVLQRVDTHPASELDDLLPHNWRRLYNAGAEAELDEALQAAADAA